MKKFRIFSYLSAIFAVLFVAGQHSALETIGSLFALVSGLGIVPGFVLGACNELTAFRLAVESLPDNVLRSPAFARANFFRNAFPSGEFVQNQGVTRSTFTIKPSAPSDDQSLWTTVTASGGITTPGCSPTFEDIGVGFFETTYSPKERNFRGPIVCKEHFEYQQAIDQFIEGYIMQLRQWLALTWEFGIRGDIMRLGDVFIDGTKYVGPNALLTAPVASQGLSQDMLDLVATDRINLGVTQGVDNGDYVLNGNAGPIYPLYINMVESQHILRSNPHMRDDAHWASATHQGAGDFGLWQALGTTRTIGNFRHVTTNMEPRFNYTSTGYVTVPPFKDITVVGTDQEIFTTAYKNAPYAAALVPIPSGMTIEAVRPQNAGLAFDMSNYNGELEFITGGERICDPGVYDPRHEKGRHFAKIIYAAAPKFQHSMATVIYKRCAITQDLIFCS
jgi:hypothetical protein